MTVYKQPHETKQAYCRRIIANVREQCRELDYENDTGRPSIERIDQMIGWLALLAKAKGETE